MEDTTHDSRCHGVGRLWEPIFKWNFRSQRWGIPTHTYTHTQAHTEEGSVGSLFGPKAEDRFEQAAGERDEREINHTNCKGHIQIVSTLSFLLVAGGGGILLSTVTVHFACFCEVIRMKKCYFYLFVSSLRCFLYFILGLSLELDHFLDFTFETNFEFCFWSLLLYTLLVYFIFFLF